ncbi:methyltransferase domain-containing protein [Jeongeupia wiesaeckerbachi]|uniref:SAM-dependent methyltransferase n=1 Tax=Jeongeupia wiesaeckerbachi TaxID=3051218 RepID=UPI003D804376
MEETQTIAAMPLYQNVHRIDAELAAQGIAASSNLTAEQLFPYDQYHYHGTAAVEAAVQRLRLGSHSRVLDVGAGLGGPARYLAHTLGAHVTALELQQALHLQASRLTQRCGLARSIDHQCGDALTADFAPGRFDAVVSWLAILHIPERRRLLTRLRPALCRDGSLYIEDFCLLAPLNAAEADAMRNTVHGVTLTTVADYAADLEAAGFVDVQIDDPSAAWGAFCRQRAAFWRDDRARLIGIHGEADHALLDHFYKIMAALFDGGRLGGIRIVARAP